MAAEALNKKGAEMGISVKVETNGSAGAKNVLTKEDFVLKRSVDDGGLSLPLMGTIFSAFCLINS